MKAVLLSYNWEDGEVLATRFNGEKTKSSAVAIKDSIKSDFPTPPWEHIVIADKEANDEDFKLLTGIDLTEEEAP